MLNQQSPLNCTSTALEKAAIARFRSLAIGLPQDCQVFREPWGCSTVLCVDFQACPTLLEETRKQSHILVIASQHLGLAQSVIFRVGNKVIGWTSLTNPESKTD